MEPILPPLLRRPPCRPHKSRRKESGAPSGKQCKLGKRGMQLSCRKCGKPSHSMRTCKGAIGGNNNMRRQKLVPRRRNGAKDASIGTTQMGASTPQDASIGITQMGASTPQVQCNNDSGTNVNEALQSQDNNSIGNEAVTSHVEHASKQEKSHLNPTRHQQVRQVASRYRGGKAIGGNRGRGKRMLPKSTTNAQERGKRKICNGGQCYWVKCANCVQVKKD